MGDAPRTCITSIERTGSNVTISWNSTPGVSYTIQHSIDLENWTDVPVGETDTWTDENITEPVKFYKVFE